MTSQILANMTTEDQIRKFDQIGNMLYGATLILGNINADQDSIDHANKMMSEYKPIYLELLKLIKL